MQIYVFFKVPEPLSKTIVPPPPKKKKKRCPCLSKCPFSELFWIETVLELSCLDKLSEALKRYWIRWRETQKGKSTTKTVHGLAHRDGCSD